MTNLNTPISELTAGELLDLLAANSQGNLHKEQSQKQYAYGIAGLAKIANCSLPTAQKLKNSGLIPFSQAGRKIIFDVDAVLLSLKKTQAKKQSSK